MTFSCPGKPIYGRVLPHLVTLHTRVDAQSYSIVMTIEEMDILTYTLTNSSGSLFGLMWLNSIHCHDFSFGRKLCNSQKYNEKSWEMKMHYLHNSLHRIVNISIIGHYHDSRHNATHIFKYIKMEYCRIFFYFLCCRMKSFWARSIKLGRIVPLGQFFQCGKLHNTFCQKKEVTLFIWGTALPCILDYSETVLDYTYDDFKVISLSLKLVSDITSRLAIILVTTYHWLFLKQCLMLYRISSWKFIGCK